MAVGGQDLTIHLRARRFLCDSSTCSRKTFAERFPELVAPYGRRTLLLRQTLETIALALGGRPAARLAQGLRVEASRSTLLRLLRALPVPQVGSLAAVGVRMGDEIAQPHEPQRVLIIVGRFIIE
ncbi:hypothetical protein ACTXG6_19315 [Pseudonocardia sp. Cha107L01]|jgi:hypothetical protein|uniref:hypothetical protein n=1 Tax=Pseudonocardia sp. Cha107L01 TaxID=3457576 RepID=UPI00403EAC53